MFKTVLIIAGTGFLLLLIAIIVLGSLNWSEKFYTPLAGLGLALAGTLAGLITVVAMLKGDTLSDAFTTFIIVNTDNHLPVAPIEITPSNSALMRNRDSLMSRLLDYRSLAASKIYDNSGNETILFEVPQKDSDEMVFYEELLQYKLVIAIMDMHNPNPWVTVTLGPPGLSLGKNKPFQLSEAEKKPLIDVCPDISKLRFSNNPVEKETIKLYSSRLPKDTKITLQQITSTEKTGTEKDTIVLTKPYFFTIEITIEPGMYSGQKSLPASSGLLPELATKSKVLMFQISMVARFERLTGGNYRTGELKNWAKWMFGQLESKFSDMTPQ